MRRGASRRLAATRGDSGRLGEIASTSVDDAQFRPENDALVRPFEWAIERSRRARPPSQRGFHDAVVGIQTLGGGLRAASRPRAGPDAPAARTPDRTPPPMARRLLGAPRAGDGHRVPGAASGDRARCASSRAVAWALSSALALALSGCGIQRALDVSSSPPGARLTVNGHPHGTTPQRIVYTEYWLFTFRLEKDGYEAVADEVRTVTERDALPGIDFFSENFGGRRQRVTTKHYDLVPLPRTPPSTAEIEATLRRAREAREPTAREMPEPGTPTPARPHPLPAEGTAGGSGSGKDGAPPSGSKTTK